ncbi:PhzF family phenazine biosynthesis protein [Rhodoferax sp.]|uniref:PhzF family phenazine biosynthesis protein n=1 Tax=Rhodoferax sp. TaxID=50421 RepID=UPI00261DB947|nr:PhzF family phenazine biosynthesis protein [Rhodoferax sp.]MDD2926786.1 PhzF family phenazine biosynthesis protein [Rhodoferax sp.]
MKNRPFKQVDVFTDTPYLGNPLAVVLDGSDLSTEDMQHFAQWTNLSETTFLLPPSAEAAAQGADYRVRIFTPGGELPFAGHPTLGSCHAWLQAGGQPRASQTIVQECAKGLVAIRKDGRRLAFAAPSLRRSAPDPALVTAVAQALGLAPDAIVSSQLLDNGPVWLALLVNSQEAVLALTPDHAELKRLGQKVGLAHIESASVATNLIARSNREARAFGGTPASGAAPADAPVGLTVRAFAAPIGVPEDPVTGSLNASLAQWLMTDGLTPNRYVATQGTCLGRHGQVYLARDEAGQVWVGGDVVTCIDGQVLL